MRNDSFFSAPQLKRDPLDGAMRSARVEAVRAYLMPFLGLAVIAGGILDLGRGTRAVLAYSRAAYPVPLTLWFVGGLGLMIMGLGSIAIGYHAMRHPLGVPLTMLSVMVTFLTWQVVVSFLLWLIQPYLSLNGRPTTSTKAFVLASLISLIGAYVWFRALRRWLQAYRHRGSSAPFGASAV